jgi:hypothetical protein
MQISTPYSQLLISVMAAHGKYRDFQHSMLSYSAINISTDTDPNLICKINLIQNDYTILN